VRFLNHPLTKPSLVCPQGHVFAPPSTVRRWIQRFNHEFKEAKGETGLDQDEVRHGPRGKGVSFMPRQR
jgi:hypothetical protein